MILDAPETGRLTTKAVILARGLGTRMRRADPASTLDASQTAVADSGVKGMMSVGRPFLDYVLSALADAGIHQVCLVIGPEHGIVRHYYEGDGKPTRLSVEFAIQPEPLGTANAVLAARPYAGKDAFIVLNSDNYYPAHAIRALAQVPAPAIAGFRRRTLIELGNVPRERIARFGALKTDAQGFLERILVGEEADTAAGDDALASMNCWLFDFGIFDACVRVPLSTRGEYELPQAVKLGIAELGMRIRVVPVDAGVLDLSTRSDVATVTRRLRSLDVRV